MEHIDVDVIIINGEQLCRGQWLPQQELIIKALITTSAQSSLHLENAWKYFFHLSFDFSCCFCNAEAYFYVAKVANFFFKAPRFRVGTAFPNPRLGRNLPMFSFFSFF